MGSLSDWAKADAEAPEPEDDAEAEALEEAELDDELADADAASVLAVGRDITIAVRTISKSVFFICKMYQPQTACQVSFVIASRFKVAAEQAQSVIYLSGRRYLKSFWLCVASAEDRKETGK